VEAYENIYALLTVEVVQSGAAEGSAANLLELTGGLMRKMLELNAEIAAHYPDLAKEAGIHIS
jgi:hypothetical protein